jgi:hypothetical protein
MKPILKRCMGDFGEGIQRCRTCEASAVTNALRRARVDENEGIRRRIRVHNKGANRCQLIEKKWQNFNRCEKGGENTTVFDK